MMTQTKPQPVWSQWQVRGSTLLATAKNVVHEGNVHRILITQDRQTVVEFPLTVGVIGTFLAPTLVAIGAISALLTGCTIEVERVEPPAQLRV